MMEGEEQRRFGKRASAANTISAEFTVRDEFGLCGVEVQICNGRK